MAPPCDQIYDARETEGARKKVSEIISADALSSVAVKFEAEMDSKKECDTRPSLEKMSGADEEDSSSVRNISCAIEMAVKPFLVESQRTIDRLSAELMELRAREEDREKDMERMLDENNTLRQQICDWNKTNLMNKEQVDHLGGRVAVVEEERDRLIRQVNERDSHVTDLKQQVRTYDAQVKDLSAKLSCSKADLKREKDAHELRIDRVIARSHEIKDSTVRNLKEQLRYAEQRESEMEDNFRNFKFKAHRLSKQLLGLTCSPKRT